jgi:hypothetical protein
MKVLVDNGHGSNTLGKRSPDGRLLEYKWAREIAARIVEALHSRGIESERIVTEDSDISLAERCRRVNNICSIRGAADVLLVSVHVNAASSGGWQSARGWSGWVYTKAGSQSKRLARLLYTEAARHGLKGNRSVPSCRYWTADFYILKNTACPAVLTENLFQDNRDDVEYLLSEEGKDTIVQLHVDGIVNYINSMKK